MEYCTSYVELYGVWSSIALDGKLSLLKVRAYLCKTFVEQVIKLS